MTACINRPEIMSSAVVFWKSAILSVSAWISSVNICTWRLCLPCFHVLAEVKLWKVHWLWRSPSPSGIQCTNSHCIAIQVVMKSFKGKDNTQQLSLSLSLNTVALSQWGFLMHRQLVCHRETKLHLSLSWMHLTGRHLSFMYQNMHVLVPLWFLSWLVQMLLVVISPMRKQHLYGAVLLVGLSNLLSLGENDWDGSLNQDSLYLLRIYLIPMWSEITTKERTVKSWRQTSHHWKWDN